MVAMSVERKASVWGYQGGQTREFIRITTALPTYIASARGQARKDVCGGAEIPPPEIPPPEILT